MTTRQDEIFRDKEGDAYFQRNQSSPYLGHESHDWPCQILASTRLDRPVRSIIELGCFNGFRLERLRSIYPEARLVGIDASKQAIEHGKKLFPNVDLHQGILADCPVTDAFDVVIVHFVLHWVDRANLLKSITQIDERVDNGGYLLIGDFSPNSPVSRPYHHLEDMCVSTYKQNYAQIFESTCLYKELSRVSFNHDTHGQQAESAPSNSRASCSILRKSLGDYYANS